MSGVSRSIAHRLRRGGRRHGQDQVAGRPRRRSGRRRPPRCAGIAAITFTEAAASELRDRIRTALAEAGETDAVDQVDEAAISTLHGFAQRILAEHPFEAGLPPAVEVLDEIQSSLAFDERWTAFLDRLFADPALRDGRCCAPPRCASTSTTSCGRSRSIFNDHWDRLGRRSHRRPAAVARRRRRRRRPPRRARSTCGRHCSDDGDKLPPTSTSSRACPSAAQGGRRARAAAPAAACAASTATRASRRTTPGCDVDEIRERAASRPRRPGPSCSPACGPRCSTTCSSPCARFVLDAAEQRASGRAARVPRPARAGARPRPRSTPTCAPRWPSATSHLLIDEFQDTDPIQIELAIVDRR